MLKAIIFDYNGILVDDLAYHRDAYIRVAEELGYTLTPEAIWEYISATPDEKRHLFGDISDDTWRQIRGLKDKYYFEMIEKADFMIPDVEEVLTGLHSKYQLGLISNTSRSYFEKLFPQRLISYFVKTLFSEEMDNPKPAPDPLYKMMGMLNVKPQECCYVGDATSDVIMTRGTGVRMIGVTTGHHSEKDLRDAGADQIVQSLSEFVDLAENGNLL